MRKIKDKRILFITIIILGFIIFKNTEAETVTASPLSITVNDVSNIATYEGLGLKEIFFDHINETIKVNLNKNVNIINNNNLNLAKTSNVGLGQTLNIDISPTYGNWNIRNKQLNLGSYNLLSASGEGGMPNVPSKGQNLYTKVFIPDNDNTAVVTSDNSNVISCSGYVCTTRQNGVANITISFPNKTHTGSDYDRIVIFAWGDREYSYEVSTKGNLFFGSNIGFEDIKIGAYGDRSSGGGRKDTSNLKNMSYTFPSVTYTINVGDGNTPPTATCNGTSAVFEKSATINWNYQDAELEAQIQYRVELFNNPTYTDIPEKVGTGVTGTSHTFSDLATSTTYYYRIQVRDSSNYLSDWVSCGSFTTLSDEVGNGSFYCSANPVQAISGQTTTFTAYPLGGTYKWLKTSSTENPYSTKLGLGKNIMNVVVTKDNKTETVSCTARVCDGPRPSDETCAEEQETYKKYSGLNTCDDEGNWLSENASCSEGGIFNDALFYFSPNVADETNNCKAVIQANNVSSCYIQNRLLETKKIWLPRDGSINVSGESIPVGTYTLYCTGTQLGAVSTKIGSSKSCFSNPNIRED